MSVKTTTDSNIIKIRSAQPTVLMTGTKRFTMARYFNQCNLQGDV